MKQSPQIIRYWAFALAKSSLQGENSPVVLTRANEYRRYLNYCVASTNVKHLLKQFVLSALRWQLFQEIDSFKKRRLIVSLISSEKSTLEEVRVAITVEIATSNARLLGPGHNPAALTILTKLNHHPPAYIKLANSLREGRAYITKGEVVVDKVKLIKRLAMLYLTSFGWLVLVALNTKNLWQTQQDVIISVISAISALTYLFWPLIVQFREDCKTRDFVNQVPHIHK